MGNRATKYEIFSPPSYEESTLFDKLPTYEELFGNKCVEIDYKLKDSMIEYILKNNITGFTIVEFIDKKNVYVCKKENKENKDSDINYIICDGKTVEFKDNSHNPVYHVKIGINKNTDYYIVIYKQYFLSNNHSHRPL